MTEAAKPDRYAGTLLDPSAHGEPRAFVLGMPGPAEPGEALIVRVVRQLNDAGLYEVCIQTFDATLAWQDGPPFQAYLVQREDGLVFPDVVVPGPPEGTASPFG